AIHVGVEAVRDRHVDQTVFARERHRGFGAVTREREEAGACPPAEDDGKNLVHEGGYAAAPRTKVNSPDPSGSGSSATLGTHQIPASWSPPCRCPRWRYSMSSSVCEPPRSPVVGSCC